MRTARYTTHLSFLAVAAFVLVFCVSAVSASDTVTDQRIKVQLFAAPAFVSEVSVDAYDNVCVSLDNNLIDGRVQSILVGGHDVTTVMNRDDWWNCRFFDNYECQGYSALSYLKIPDGVNNLNGIDWGSRIHSLRCHNYDPSVNN